MTKKPRISVNPYLLLILLLHLFILSQTQFTPWPELHLWPYLMESGLKLYREIAFEKPPLLPAILYGWFYLTGNSLISLKLLAWLVILVTDLIVFKTADFLHGERKSVPLLTTLFYILLMTAFSGNTFWYELLLTPIFLFIFLSLEKKKFFFAGITAGLGILVKQPAVLALIPAWLVLSKQVRYNKLIFARGLFLALFPVFLVLLLTQTLGDASYWTILFPAFIAKYSFQLPVARLAILPLLMAFTFLLYRKNISLSAWGLISLFFILPRFELFHLQPALAFFSLSLAGVKNFRKNLLLIVIVLTMTVFSLRQTIASWGGEDRFYEDSTISISTWVKSHTKPGEKVFLLNTWDHIYVLSDTLPAINPWYHQLPWYLSVPGVQEEIVTDLIKTAPRLIISEGLTPAPKNEIEKHVFSSYLPSAVINDRFTIWTPKP